MARVYEGSRVLAYVPGSLADRFVSDDFREVCMKLRAGWLAVSVLFVAGCAYNPQSAQIAPNVQVASADIGRGVTVAFRVQDERPTKSLGNRGAGFGKAAEISAKDDVTAIVHDKIAAGLRQKGFTVADYDEKAPTRLSIEIRSLQYDTSVGFWTGGVKVQSALKGVAMRDGRSYERMYRSDKERRVVIVPTADKNEAWINEALTDVLTQLFDDVGLFRHLVAQ